MDEINEAKARVLDVYQAKIVAWNRYCGSAENRRANGNQYELCADRFDWAVAHLIHTFRLARARRVV